MPCAANQSRKLLFLNFQSWISFSIAYVRGSCICRFRCLRKGITLKRHAQCQQSLCFGCSIIGVLEKDSAWIVVSLSNMRCMLLRYIFDTVLNPGLLGVRLVQRAQKKTCLVHVRRFPSPTRSIRFGDVSEAKGPRTFSHGPRDPKRFGREEKWGLGTRQSYDHLFIIKRMLALEETSLTRENKID